MPEGSNKMNFLFSPLESTGGHSSIQKKTNGLSTAEQDANIEELRRVNEELRQARRAALNLMEDAIQSKEALRQSEEKYRTKLEQDVRDRTAELNASKELLQATMNASMDMIQVFEAVRNEQNEIVDFRYVLLNHEAERWMPPDTVGKRLLDLQPGVVQEGIFDVFKKVVETGIPDQREHHYVHEQFNGWYYQSVVKLGDGVATTTANITGRKKAELEVQQSRTLLQTVIDAPNIGMAVYKTVRNERGEIIDFVHEYINKASLQMLGGEDFTGRLFSDHGENAIVQMPQLIQVIETGKGNRYIREAELHGRKFWFAITNTAIDGERLVHTWEDITERKKAEQEILALKDAIAQKATDKYQTLFNSIDQGFCLIETIFDEAGKAIDFRYLETNAVYEHQTGLKMEGKLASEIVPNTEDIWFESLGEVARTGNPLRFENFHEPTGHWYAGYASRVGGEGSSLLTLVFDDVTERKRRELNRELLNEISNDLSMLTSPNEIMQAVGEQLGKFMQASTCIFADVDEDKNEATIHQGWSEDNIPSLKQTFRLADYFGEEFRRAGRAGEATVVADTQHDEHANAEAYAKLQIGAFVTVPFRQQGRWKANITVTTRDARQWRQDEVDLIHEIANRVFPRIERARAEEALRQSEEKYRTLFETIDEGFSIIDLIHDDKGNLVDFVYSEINPAFTRHVGVDLRGKRRSELSFDKKDFVLEKYDHLAKTGEPLHFEHHVQAPSDQWFQVSASRIGGEDSTQLGVVFRNITERKQQEQKQQYLLQLSDALRTLSDPDEILNEALRIVGEYLDLDRVVYNEINADVTEYWHRANYVREGFASIVGRYPMGPFKETVKNLQKGITFIANDAYSNQFSEAEQEVHRSINVGAYVTVPLVKNGRWVCNLVAHYSKPRNWTEHEIDLLEETAERIWAAVERGKAEQALRVSEERLQMATSAARIGTFMFYPLEDRGEPDDQALALFGLKRDGILNLAEAMLQNIHAEDRERHMKAVMAALDPSSNGMADTEFRVVHPDGSVHWLRSVAQAYFEGDPPQPVRMPGVVIDITEHKKAEEALRKSEERLQLALSAAQLGTFTWYIAEDRTDADSRALAHFGLPPDAKSTLSDALARIFHPEDGPRYVKAIEEAIDPAGNGTLHQEFRIRRHDGERWMSVIAKTVFEGSPPVATQITGVLADITEEKQQEQQKEFILKLSDGLRPLADPNAIQETAMHILGKHLNLHRAFYGKVKDDAGGLVIGPGYSDVLSPLTEDINLLAFDADRVAQFFRNGKTVAINDVYEFVQSPKSLKEFDDMKVRAVVGVPLIKGGKMRGILSVHQSVPRQWTESEIALMEETAERTWAALERATAEEALRKNEKQLASELADVKQLQKISSKIIAAEEDEEHIYEAIVNAAMEIMHADFARLQVFKPNANHLLLFAWKAFDPASREYWKYTRINATANRQALQRRERVIVPSIDDSPEMATGELEEYHKAGIVSAQSTPLITRSGKVVGIISTQWRKVHQSSEHDLTLFDVLARQTTDLIERRQAEDALRQSEERFRTLANAVPQVIWTNTADGKATYFNQRWYEFSGLTYEQSAGPGWQAIVHPDDAPASMEKWNKALASGEIFDVEYRLRRSDGEYRWFIGRNVPMKDEGGKVTGWFGSATDIEDLKKTEEALSQSEAKLRITLESATDYGIISMDANRRVEQWSKGAESLFGYTEAEMIGQLADIIFTDEDRANGEPLKEMETVRATGRAADERWHQGKSGNRFYVSGVMRKIEGAGLTGYVKVMRDTTQQKMFTEELHRLVAERTVELQRSNENLQQFATIAAHDLQEPLRKLRLFSSVLQRYKDGLPAEGSELLAKISLTSDRMSQLIREVLQYSRLNSGVKDFEPTDLDAVLQEVLRDLDLPWKETGAQLDYTAPLPQIEAIPSQITQIFYNLLTNALKFRREGVKPVIRIASAPVSSEELASYPFLPQGRTYIKITVADNGIGFDPQFAEQIFQIFERLHSVDEFEGTGVGLALCKKIAENHDGHIFATAKEGEGASFYLLLPVSRGG